MERGSRERRREKRKIGEARGNISREVEQGWERRLEKRRKG